MGAGAVIGMAAVSAGAGVYSANKQAGAMGDASDQAAATERYLADQQAAFGAPGRQAGNQALNVLSSAFIPGWEGLDISGGSGGMGSVGQLHGYNPGADYGQQGTDYAAAFIQQGKLKELVAQYGDGADFSNRDEILNKIITPYLKSVTAKGAEINLKTQSGLLDLLWKNAGNWGKLNDYYGTEEGRGKLAPISADDLSAQFEALPGNRFMMDQANDAIQERSALTGSAIGGNALSAISNNTQQMVNQNTFNPLFQLAGFGAQGAQIGANAFAGSNEAQAQYAGGQAQANKYANMNNSIQSGIDNFMTYRNLNQQPGGWTPSTTGGVAAPVANVTAPDGLKYWGALPTT